VALEKIYEKQVNNETNYTNIINTLRTASYECLGQLEPQPAQSRFHELLDNIKDTFFSKPYYAERYLSKEVTTHL
jgi:hypothetical protein